MEYHTVLVQKYFLYIYNYIKYIINGVSHRPCTELFPVYYNNYIIMYLLIFKKEPYPAKYF